MDSVGLQTVCLLWMYLNQHIGKNTSVELENTSPRETLQPVGNAVLNIAVKSCQHVSVLFKSISFSLGTPSTLNLLRGQSGRKFAMTTRWPGWCLGQKTSRAPSSTSCWTLAPGSRYSHNFSLQPHFQSCLDPKPCMSFNISPVIP